jgi:DNA-binding response OmpR family regulator
MPRILVVEDNLEAREMLATLLRCAGYGVITAENGLEALDCAAREDPALIITDLDMPELDGIQMIGRFRSKETQLGGVPIIAVSAYGRASLDLASIAGASDSFGKPFAIEALLARIEQLLSCAAAAARPCRDRPALSRYAGSETERKNVGILKAPTVGSIQRTK